MECASIDSEAQKRKARGGAECTEIIGVLLHNTGLVCKAWNMLRAILLQCCRSRAWLLAPSSQCRSPDAA